MILSLHPLNHHNDNSLDLCETGIEVAAYGFIGYVMNYKDRAKLPPRIYLKSGEKICTNGQEVIQIREAPQKAKSAKNAIHLVTDEGLEFISSLWERKPGTYQGDTDGKYFTLTLDTWRGKRAFYVNYTGLKNERKRKSNTLTLFPV